MWNIANKLTMLRVLMVPVYVLLFGLVPQPWGRYLAFVIFAAASYTDHLDGKLARERHLITNFGKFMDPLADKLLVISALICFVGKGELAAWIVMCNMMSQTIGKAFRASFLAMARQGLFFVPAVLILPKMLGLTGVEMSQTAADLISFAFSIPLQASLLKEMTREERFWKN